MTEVLDRAEVSLRVNGEPVETTVAIHRTLVELLREELGLRGTTEGCGVGVCGCCTVLVDGEPTSSCLELAVNADGQALTTVEGIDGGVKDAFAEAEGFQCGYCTPGMVVTAAALLDDYPNPDRGTVREYMAENLCRCTGYASILDAIELAAGR